ncbi:MAG: hypothetical protein JXO22_05805 [Phycisphaerae bacterium]|nr:hypothetical protein [Phycisphaerae bacterium]
MSIQRIEQDAAPTVADLAFEKDSSPRQRRLKIGVFIDHDIFVRHFLQARVFEPLFGRHEVDVIVPPEGHRRLGSDPAPLIRGATLRRLQPHPYRHQLWARLLQVTVMRPFLDATSRELRRTWRLVMSLKAEVLYTALGTPGIYECFRDWTWRRIRRTKNGPLESLLAANYDLAIIPGTPDSPFSLDVLYECNRLGLPCLMIMNSWDNPSGNRLVSGRPDRYLVWGEQTKQHAVEFLGVPAEHVVKFGAAQFDLYRDPPRIDRTSFAHLHGVDPHKKIVLYAGGSLGTDEWADLKLLDEAIENGELGPVAIIYRPHPWGANVNRARQILASHFRHVVIESTMRGYLEAVGRDGYHIKLTDLRDTHDILSSVDALMSPLSTILIEGLLHRKPVLCFLPIDDVQARHFQAVYTMTHFRDIQRSPEVVQAHGRAELIDAARRLTAQIDDREILQRLGELSRFFVSQFDEPYGARLVRFVEDFAAQRDRMGIRCPSIS